MKCIYRVSSALVFFICTAGCGTGAEADAWLRVSDSNISIYTQGDGAEAAAVLSSLAALRSAFRQEGIFLVKEDVPLKVIAFRTEKEFQKYQLNSGSCAFYQQTGRAEYVVLQDLSEGHRDVAAHEFTHYLLTHSGVRLPLWMNEGLADFYSTFEVRGDRVTFGRQVSGRLEVLREQPWLPLEELLRVTTDSPYYSEPGRMLLFYSESWALTHMLMVDSRYAGRFAAFLRALNEGRSGVEAVGIAYQKTVVQVQEDLKKYVEQRELAVLDVKMKGEASAAGPAFAYLSSVQMDVVLGDLVPNNAETQADVRRRLVNAASVLAGSAEAEEQLGYLALREGKTAEAGVHFRAAVKRNSSDANVWFYVAQLDGEARDKRALLERAVALKPDFSDARLELALVEAGAGDYKLALELLHGVGTPRAENAYAAVYMEAFCYAHLDEFAEARAAAERARGLARDERDKAQVSELVGFLAARAR